MKPIRLFLLVSLLTLLFVSGASAQEKLGNVSFPTSHGRATRGGMRGVAAGAPRRKRATRRCDAAGGRPRTAARRTSSRRGGCCPRASCSATCCSSWSAPRGLEEYEASQLREPSARGLYGAGQAAAHAGNRDKARQPPGGERQARRRPPEMENARRIAGNDAQEKLGNVNFPNVLRSKGTSPVRPRSGNASLLLVSAR